MRRVLGVLTVLVVLAVLGKSLTAQQTAPAAPNPIVGPPLVPLAESYLRWPLPASAAAYGRIDGNHLKPYVEQLAAISRKSRDAGQQWWGRITGTPAHAEAQQFVASKLRSFGMDVRGKGPRCRRHGSTPWAVSAASGEDGRVEHRASGIRSSGRPWDWNSTIVCRARHAG